MYEYVCMYVYGNLPEQKIRFWSYPNFRGSILWYPQHIYTRARFCAGGCVQAYVRTSNLQANKCQALKF